MTIGELLTSPSAQTLFSLLGTCLSFALFVSPFQQLRSTHAYYCGGGSDHTSGGGMKSSSSTPPVIGSPVPYLAMFMNCILWMTYGVLGGNFTLVLVNFVGFLFSVYYSYLYYRIVSQPSSVSGGSSGSGKDSFLTQCSIVLLIYVLCMAYIMFFLNHHETEVKHLGYMAALCSILMFGSPLVSLRDVIQKRDASSIPLLMSLAATGCSLSWTLYGISLGDSSIVTPNFIGTLLGLVQLGLKWIYSNNGKQSGHDRGLIV